jgi:hypothetical protein
MINGGMNDLDRTGAHDQPWDENTPEAHRAVARAILDTGLDPLDLD